MLKSLSNHQIINQKINVMKKILFPLLSLLFCGISSLQAQCDLFITTNFDSECLLTEYIKERPSLWEQDFGNCLLACKGNTVQYTAVCSGTVSQYSWTISGAASYYFTNQNKTAVVTWGNNNDVGNISVNVVTSDTNSCTEEVCVLLMESPTIGSNTVPNYYNQNGQKVIEVCRGQTIELMDMSTTELTPIVGYQWITPFGDASTPNHTIIASQTGNFSIKHFVQNECGCEGYEEIILRVVEELKLELSCYGTVCAGSNETYTLLNPYCSQYMWSVEGGTYTTDPSNPATIDVQWGNPSSGYGVISIDAAFCDAPCKAMASIKIPVITDSAEISGPDVVCVGDYQLFELPIWGSTYYLWNISPSVGDSDMVNTEEINQVLLRFQQPGTYRLSARYGCDFIPCGPDSTEKTIIVKDTMSIKSSDNTLCKGATGSYTTWHGNSVTWRVYNQNNTQIYYTNGVSLNYTFTSAGRYRIVASNSNYCKDAEYLVTVLNNPPALTITNGPHSACPNSSILLSATPSHPNYYLEWVQLCAPYNTETGDEVTIDYGNTVCDVAVYQIDAENNCRSDAYIHEVDIFQLAPHGMPAVTVACAGSIVPFSVPNQPNVTYEWTISPANAASVIDDHLSYSVNILTNHLVNGINPPYFVDVILKRTCCDNIEVYDTVQIEIIDIVPPTINCSTIVCQHEPTLISTTGGSSVSSDYTWQFSDTTLIFHGAGINRAFHHPGTVTFTLTYQPDPNCDPAIVTGSLYVRQLPVAVITRSGNTLSVPQQTNVSYDWYQNNTSLNCYTSSYTSNNNISGTYCCIVTYNDNPACEAQGCYAEPTPPPSCDDINVQYTQPCNVVTISAQNLPNAQFSWALSTYALGSNITPNSTTEQAVATFNVPGYHHIFVTTTYNGVCHYHDEPIVVDCVPKFELSYDCNGNIEIIDKSLYRSGYAIPDRTFTTTIAGVNYSVTLTYPSMSDQIYIGCPTNSTYTVTMTMDGSACTCSESITLEPDPVITSVNIPNYMCENTPFLFSVLPNNNNYEYYWDFGDDSYNYGNGLYHTYNSNYNYYDLSLEIFNSFHCKTNYTQRIFVSQNNIINGTITMNGTAVCPGNFRQITFQPHVYLDNHYYWNYSPTWVYDNYYNTTETGDYHVLVITSNYGCKKESMLNVGFLNAPTARITGNTTYCLGEEVKLNGNTGITNQYSWTITDPNNNLLNIPNSANITFTPTEAGVYNVTLVVTSTDGCTKTATCTVTVHPQPAAPPISFYGNQCIHTPPVYVHSTATPAQPLLWSNGFHGSSAQYYVPGYLTAHYIDQTTGCPSAKSTLFIPPAPNYDALLTGCYEKCPEELPTYLYVYNFYPYNATNFHWYWYENNYSTANGTTLNANLPINNFGYYFMKTQFGNGCVAQSPTLNISKKAVCPCNDITVSVEKKCEMENCHLMFGMTVTIHNSGTQTAYFNQLTTNANSHILSVNTLPVIVPANSSQAIYIELDFLDFANPYIEFTLHDPENDCEYSFSENFDWEGCIENECEVELNNIVFWEVSSPHQTSYFHFNIALQSGSTSVLSSWSTPSQITHYTYDPYMNCLEGILMLNYGQLTQMALAGEYICLHAIVCIEDSYLCYLKVCIKAEEILGLIPEEYRQIPASTTADNDSTRSLQSSSFIPQAGKPYLAPNPARDEVMVMGIAPEEVAEITVLTMQGGQVAEFRNDYRFNVSRLAKASYIVRVITTNKQVYYLKLVKQ